MTKMTKTQTAKLAKLEAVKEFETQNIYAAAAPRNDVRFNDCYAMASEPGNRPTSSPSRPLRLSDRT